MTIALGARYSPFDKTASACLPPVAELEALILEEAGVRDPVPPRLSLLKAFVDSIVPVDVEVKLILAGVRMPDTDVHDCSRYVTTFWLTSYQAASIDLQLVILCRNVVRSRRSLSVRSAADT